MHVRKRIGLLVPSTNTTCEPDFYRTISAETTVHTHRLWLTNDSGDADAVDRMNAEVEQGARYLKTANVDVVVYGCTTGSFYKGPGYDSEMLELIEAASGVPAVATSPAAAEALRSVGAKKISVATPYPDWSNRQLRSYYEKSGFEILNVDGEPVAAKAGPQGINDQHPDTVLEFAPSVCKPEADALFCSCTAWRSFEVVRELERRVGRPVITSNQATVWATLKKLGVSRPESVFGSLFSGATGSFYGHS